MNRDYLQDALHTFNGGNWYGWKTHDDNGNKIPNYERMQYQHIKIPNDQRMCYECIEVIKDGATIPSEADVNAKIQELKDAETNAIDKKASAKTKLKALGLDDAELKTLGL
jgi:flagellar hook protein FlgE